MLKRQMFSLKNGTQQNLISWFVHQWLIEGLVRKPCRENNGAAIYVGRAATLQYLNKNASSGQLLQHMHSKFDYFLCRGKAEKANKNI